MRTGTGKWSGMSICVFRESDRGGEAESLDEEFVRRLTADWKPDVVMGKAALVEALERILPGYDMAEKNLYLLESGDGLLEEDGLLEGAVMKRGVPGDEDKIHAFLMEIPEIRALYASKDMIADRLPDRGWNTSLSGTGRGADRSRQQRGEEPIYSDARRSGGEKDGERPRPGGGFGERLVPGDSKRGEEALLFLRQGRRA